MTKKHNAMRMPTTLDPERAAKIPVWLREHIYELESTTKVAVDRWNALQDSQEVTRIAVGDIFNAPVYVKGTSYSSDQVQVDVTPVGIFDRRKDEEGYLAREWLTVRPMTHEVADPMSPVPVQVMANRSMTIRMTAANAMIVTVER